MATIERGWFSIKDAAAYASLNPMTVYRWVQSKILPASAIPNKDGQTSSVHKCWRIRKVDLDAFLMQFSEGRLAVDEAVDVAAGVLPGPGSPARARKGRGAA